MPVPTAQRRPFWSASRLAWALGSAAGLAVLMTIAGPGITTDEPLDVRPGRTYVETLSKRGPAFFERATVDAVFRDNAEHPPLGRWLLGIASTLGQPFEIAFLGGPDPIGLYVQAGRLAPAAAFALLVGLVTRVTAARYGLAAGSAAGFALAVMPRPFAHAHLAALDTFIAAFWVAALFAADRALTSPRPTLGMAGAGLVWGLALLTKIHGWLLLPVVFVWALVRLGPRRGLPAFSAWLAAGLGLFWAGWPWLWFDPVGRLSAYLGTGVARASIRVTYFGRVFADRDVPWHYPWFYFAATIPVGLLVFGGLGLVQAWKARRVDPFPLLLIGSIVMFLTLFSTRVPVYDGERLFLMTFPLWAVFVGLGFGCAFDRSARSNVVRGCLAAVLAAQAYGVVSMHPFQLSYYNALVGGLPGAERAGLELTYWGDAVDAVLLDRLAAEAPERADAALAPTLYPGQGMASTTRAMAARGIVMKDDDAAGRAEWVVVSRRTAYWSQELRRTIGGLRPVQTRSRCGVWLAALYHTGAGPTPRVSDPGSTGADSRPVTGERPEAARGRPPAGVLRGSTDFP